MFVAEQQNLLLLFFLANINKGDSCRVCGYQTIYNLLCKKINYTGHNYVSTQNVYYKLIK